MRKKYRTTRSNESACLIYH